MCGQDAAGRRGRPVPSAPEDSGLERRSRTICPSARSLSPFIPITRECWDPLCASRPEEHLLGRQRGSEVATGGQLRALGGRKDPSGLGLLSAPGNSPHLPAEAATSGPPPGEASGHGGASPWAWASRKWGVAGEDRSF